MAANHACIPKSFRGIHRESSSVTSDTGNIWRPSHDRRTIGRTMVYKRGRIWFYNFTFQGDRYNRSTGETNKRKAEAIEAKLRSDLAMGRFGLAAAKPCPALRKFLNGEFMEHVRTRHKDKPRTVK